MSIVFHSRCKPQEVDAIDLVLKFRQVFIGYPMHVSNTKYDPHNIISCVVDPSASDETWNTAREVSDKRREYNRNRNLIRKVDAEQDRIVLISRPSRGFVYCGKVEGMFTLENDPAWYDDYMRIRSEAGYSDDGPDFWHAADVAQCWRVSSFEAVPIPKIPVWIRRSLLGRSTYGLIYKDPEIGIDPYDAIVAAMDAGSNKPLEWTEDVTEVGIRLVTSLTPSAFEHLMVAILQLENKNEIWSHVGGSGDGGLDGVGSRSDGTVSSLLQCKWQYWGGDPFAQQSAWGLESSGFKKILAFLRRPDNIALPCGIDFIDRATIAGLVIKHSRQLPQAISMRVGPAPT